MTIDHAKDTCRTFTAVRSDPPTRFIPVMTKHVPLDKPPTLLAGVGTSRHRLFVSFVGVPPEAVVSAGRDVVIRDNAEERSIKSTDW